MNETGDNVTRLLVVEDSPTQAEELRLILESDGFEVETAADGRKGLERVRAAPFDLVISDILMPGLSGYELCRNIKCDAATRDIPVILLTMLSDPMDVIQGLECGADNFLTKPWDQDNLLARVRFMLENRRFRAEGRMKIGVEILFLGRKFVITSEKQQVVDLLLSTFEDVVRKHRELQNATTNLRAANQELEAFSYSVSHDLRAPLRRVDGFAQALFEEYADSLGPTGQGYLRAVREGAQRIAGIIEDLLQLARVSRSELRCEKVDLAELVEVVATTLQSAEPERSVELVVPSVLPCRGDSHLLRVLLENLLGNAWKFTAKTDLPRIEIGKNETSDETIFYVRDNGAGFDMHYAHKLFAPFQRLHADSEFPGTGVGLATVRRVVQRHGGRVWAEGAPESGATFYFTLPSVAPERNP